MNREFACLAIETATERGSVAACRGPRIAWRESRRPSAQSRHLFRLVEEVLSELELALDELDCLALGVGPGSFTGLRVAAAAAQGLAFGAARPVCRISTLATLALAARDHPGVPIASCLDARMNEAYLGIYRHTDGELHAECDDRLVDPEHFVVPGAHEFVAVGPGWQAHAALAERHRGRIRAVLADRWPSAVDALSLAARQFELGHAVSAELALPNYVRDTVTRAP